MHFDLLEQLVGRWVASTWIRGELSTLPAGRRSPPRECETPKHPRAPGAVGFLERGAALDRKERRLLHEIFRQLPIGDEPPREAAQPLDLLPPAIDIVCHQRSFHRALSVKERCRQSDD